MKVRGWQASSTALPLIHWDRVTQLNPPMWASLAGQPALWEPLSTFQVESQAAHQAHPAFSGCWRTKLQCLCCVASALSPHRVLTLWGTIIFFSSVAIYCTQGFYFFYRCTNLTFWVMFYFGTSHPKGCEQYFTAAFICIVTLSFFSCFLAIEIFGEMSFHIF